MKRIATAVLAVSLFTLSACGGDVEAPGTEPAGKVVIEGDSDIQVYLITLDDGTVCAVSDGNRSGGISCDW